MTEAIVLQSQNNNSLVPSQASDIFKQYVPNAWLLDELDKTKHKARYSRMMLYVQWLDDTGNHWTNPRLKAYANYLISDERVTTKHNGIAKQRSLSPSSAKAHLATIRGVYHSLMDVDFDEHVKLVVSEAYPNKDEANKRALYLGMIDTIRKALDPKETGFIKTTKKQDTIDSDNIRLTKTQAEALIHAPNINTLLGLRDTAMLYFMLSTGLREAELCALDVADLRQTSDNELGVFVREGKGAKQRFVPYGELSKCLQFVDAWLAQAGITEGAVFRGFKDKYTSQYAPNADKQYINSKGDTIRIIDRLTKRLTVRAVNSILKSYPVYIDGQLITICPHDTRRTYARLLWDNGLDLLAIRDNLGHKDVKTTQGYIGNMGMDKRRAPNMLGTQYDSKLMMQLA